MPINRIAPSKRGAAAVTAIMAAATAGYVMLFPGLTVHDDTALAVKYLTKDWEGRRLVAYLDKIPKPPRWTICDGDTTNVKPGMVETNDGCNKRIAVKMERDYRSRLVSCVSQWDKQPISWRAAALDLSWNLGPQGVCNSSAVGVVNEALRKGKKPDYINSCGLFTLYNRSGGKVVNGLVKRRENGDATRIGEAELCLSGLPR
jgi:lysozyme